VKLPNRVGLITLACRDVDRMTQLFRDLGWPETAQSDANHRTFQCENGVVIGLYAASRYEPEFGPPTEQFRGTTICINVGSYDEVTAVYETLQGTPGVELLEEPGEAFWGGGFSWRDPEGNVWDVAWAKGTTFDDRGGVHFP